MSFHKQMNIRNLLKKYNEDVVNKSFQRRINNFKLNLPYKFKI